MEPEVLKFSPLQLILFVMVCPALFAGISQQNDWVFILTHNPFVLIFSIVAAFYLWRLLRITIWTLIGRPAVILISEAITITNLNYTISWIDVMDVYEADGGKSKDGQPSGNVYVIIRVREPEKYLNAIKNPFTRWFRWYTRNWKPSPFEVNLTLVRGDNEENYHLILKYYQHNRKYFQIPSSQ